MPTVIDELAMTLTLDPSAFKEGAGQAKTAADQLLQSILSSLNKIEGATQASADRLANIDKKSAQDREARERQSSEDREQREKSDAAKREKREEDASQNTDKRQKRSAENTTKVGTQMTESYDRVGAAIKKAGIELLAFLGISMTVRGIEKLFMDTENANRATGQLAATLDISAQRLSEWERVGMHFGLTADQVAGGIQSISDELVKMGKTGESRLMAPLFEGFRVPLRDELGHVKTTEQLIMDIAKARQERNMSGKDTALWMREAGLAPLTNLVMQDPNVLQGQLREQRRLGTGVTDEDVRQAQALLDAQAHLNDQFKAMGMTISRELGPQVTKFFQDISRWLEQNKDTITNGLIAALRLLGTFLDDIAKDFMAAFDSAPVQGAITAVKTLSDELDKLTGKKNSWLELTEDLFEAWLGWRFVKMVANIRLVRGLLSTIPGAVPEIPEAAPGAAGVVKEGLTKVAPFVAGNVPAMFLYLQAIGAYGAFQQKNLEGQAAEMGYKPGTVLGEFGTVQSFTKDGKEVDRFEMEELAKKHLRELGDAADKLKEAADALKASQEKDSDAFLRQGEAQAYIASHGGSSPGGFTGTVPPPSSMILSEDQMKRAASVRDDLAKDLNMSSAAASGIVGNLVQESGLQGIESASGDIGWAQWRGPRRKEFLEYAASHSLDWRSPEANYGFLRHELLTKYPELLQKLRELKGTPEEIARQSAFMIMQEFEKPAERMRNNVIRGNWATKVLGAAPMDLPGSAPQPDADIPFVVPTQTMGANTTAQRMQLASNSHVNNSRSSQTTISEVNVYTQATDAHGIARDIKQAMHRYDYVVPADTGLA